jgi:hypothetical protein
MSLAEALLASGPAADRGDPMMLYGQFVGEWDGRLLYHGETELETTAEVHFGWVLEGRAVQDVWIAPSKVAGSPSGQPVPPRGELYGTTLRVYDPAKDEWGITWVNPVTGAFNRMTGRAVGKDIVQEYREADGRWVQWCFFEIKADSFHWVWRESSDEGAHWTVRGEFYLKRRSRSPQALSLKP